MNRTLQTRGNFKYKLKFESVPYVRRSDKLYLSGQNDFFKRTRKQGVRLNIDFCDFVMKVWLGVICTIIIFFHHPRACVLTLVNILLHVGKIYEKRVTRKWTHFC